MHGSLCVLKKQVPSTNISSIDDGGTSADADQRKQRQNFKRKNKGKNLIEK